MVENNMEYAGLKDIFAGVATATLGSYITILLVERSFREQEEHRRQRIQAAALRQIQGSLNSHLSFLSEMYIVALEEYPSSPPASYAELFNGDFDKQVQLLDFERSYPTAGDGPNPDWFQISENEISNLRNQFDKTINQYAGLMEPELVETLQSIKESELTKFLTAISEANIRKLDSDFGVDRQYTVLFGHDDIISSHTDAVLNLVQRYEDVSIDITPIEDQGAWQDNVTPHAGSARVENNPSEMEHVIEIKQNIEEDVVKTGGKTEKVRRTTAPMDEYSRREVLYGLIVFFIGITISFGIPLLVST
ncbi:DUF7550 family protein [Natrinema marinum]|uniref:DUF7550 family protein n=1 Tax=Natrinema marinum TaxID=2961598 RepID=UPI0020C8367E|nr:hypothetical protein [Natrinema marinum]